MDSFEYTVTDNSFFFVVEDEYYVPSNTVGQVLNVLAHDWDCSSSNDALTIVDVGLALNSAALCPSRQTDAISFTALLPISSATTSSDMWLRMRLAIAEARESLSDPWCRRSTASSVPPTTTLAAPQVLSQ